MRKRKMMGLLLIIIMALSIFAGCGSDKDISEGKADGEQSDGLKTLVYARGTDVISFDLFNTGFISPMIVTKLICDPLVWQDEDGNFSPYLAKEWEVNGDATEWTFYLRDDVVFSDGTKFDGTHVKASYEYPVENSLQSKGVFEIIEEIQILDNGYTVKFICSEPCGTMLTNMWNYPVMKADILAQGPTVVSKTPVGTGPYMLDKWEVGTKVTVKRNPNFWGETYYYDVIEHQYVKEESVRLASVQTGIADIAESISEDLSATVENDDNVNILRKSLADMLWLCLRTDIAPFNDKKARQALSLCLDRDVFVKLTGGGEVAKGLLPSSVLGHDKNLDYLKYDPESAKKLLEESSYKGEEIRLIAYTGSYAKGQEQLEAIQGMMQAVGFNVKLELYDSAGFTAKRSAADFNLFWGGGAHVGYDPASFLTQRIVNNTMHHNYKNDKLFELINLGGQAATGEERQKYYQEAIQLMNEEAAPFVPIFSYLSNFAVSSDVDMTTIEKAIRTDRIPNLRMARGVQ